MRQSEILILRDRRLRGGERIPRPREQTIGGQLVAIVQWSNWTTDSSAMFNPGVLTFQVQLWQNGEVVFAYQTMEGDPASNWSLQTHLGSSATIGLQDLSGTEDRAISYSVDQADAVRSGFALRFRPRP